MVHLDNRTPARWCQEDRVLKSQPDKNHGNEKGTFNEIIACLLVMMKQVGKKSHKLVQEGENTVYNQTLLVL